MIIFQTHQFSDSHIIELRNVQKQILYRNYKTLLWNLQPKNEVAATNDKDMQAQNAQLSEIRGFRRNLHIIRHLPATL